MVKIISQTKNFIVYSYYLLIVKIFFSKKENELYFDIKEKQGKSKYIIISQKLLNVLLYPIKYLLKNNLFDNIFISSKFPLNFVNFDNFCSYKITVLNCPNVCLNNVSCVSVLSCDELILKNNSSLILYYDFYNNHLGNNIKKVINHNGNVIIKDLSNYMLKTKCFDDNYLDLNKILFYSINNLQLDLNYGCKVDLKDVHINNLNVSINFIKKNLTTNKLLLTNIMNVSNLTINKVKYVYIYKTTPEYVFNSDKFNTSIYYDDDIDYENFCCVGKLKVNSYEDQNNAKVEQFMMKDNDGCWNSCKYNNCILQSSLNCKNVIITDNIFYQMFIVQVKVIDVLEYDTTIYNELYLFMKQ